MDGGFIPELGEALPFVLPAGQYVHVVTTRRHSLGQAVAELGCTVDMGRVGIRRYQNGEGFVGVGNGHDGELLMVTVRTA